MNASPNLHFYEERLHNVLIIQSSEAPQELVSPNMHFIKSAPLGVGIADSRSLTEATIG